MPDPSRRLIQEWTFPEDAGVYEEVFLGRWPLIAAHAAARGRELVWATTTGAMLSKARNEWRRLMLVQSMPEFVTWGDLLRVYKQKPSILRELVIVGDVDFEQGNPVRRMLSGDGSLQHREIVLFIQQLARESDRDMILLHREGWHEAFDYRAAVSFGAQGKAPPPPAMSAQEKREARQAIIVTRIAGLVALLIASFLFSGGHPGWGVAVGLLGLLMAGTFFSKLPRA